MTPRGNKEDAILQLAVYLEQEAPDREAWDGNEQEALREVAGRIRLVANPVVGYVIAERHISGPDAGHLDIDWDGRVYETREAADAELALANRSLEDDPAQTPADHWKLYELREAPIKLGTAAHELYERYSLPSDKP